MICEVGIEQAIRVAFHFPTKFGAISASWVTFKEESKFALPLFTQKIPRPWLPCRARFESRHPLRQSNIVIQGISF
jgi:hypothetical protein